MTFDLDTAKKVVAHYSYLIGQDISDKFPEHTIHHIVIAPADTDQFATFIGAFNQNENNEASLLASGFDKSKVKAILIHHDKWRGDIFHYDLDKYLTKKQIEKVYLNPDFSANPNQQKNQ